MLRHAQQEWINSIGSEAIGKSRGNLHLRFKRTVKGGGGGGGGGGGRGPPSIRYADLHRNIFPCICPALLIETQEIGKVTTNIANSTRETRSQVNRSGWLKIACIYNVIVEDFVEDAKSTSQINKALKTDKIGKVGVNVEEKWCWSIAEPKKRRMFQRRRRLRRRRRRRWWRWRWRRWRPQRQRQRRGGERGEEREREKEVGRVVSAITGAVVLSWRIWKWGQ